MLPHYPQFKFKFKSKARKLDLIFSQQTIISEKQNIFISYSCSYLKIQVPDPGIFDDWKKKTLKISQQSFKKLIKVLLKN